MAVISLGLALALNTTMFALADAVLHPYAPYPNPDRIASAFFMGGDLKHFVPHETRFAAVRDGMHSYDRISSYTWLGPTMVVIGTSSEYRQAVGVGPGFFDVLSVRPMLGRVFDASDFAPANGQVAVISFRLWNRLFNARPLSETLTLDVANTRYHVIGVMPRGVHLPGTDTEIWLPSTALAVGPTVHAFGPMPIVRLRPAATGEMFRSELATIAARLTADYTPQRPLYARVLVGAGSSAQLALPHFVMATAAMVLIIACANLGTMLLARGIARRRDTAIRLALGAARRDIIREVLCECGIIGTAGVASGMLLTWWALYIMPHFTILPIPELGDILPVPSWRVFCFALAITVGTILLAGALPALRAAGTDPAEPMKEGSASTTGTRRDRYNPLIIVEVALSTALLMCSALFVIVAVRLAAFDFRYAAKELVTANFTPNAKSVKSGEESRFWDDVMQRAAQLPHARYAATRSPATPNGKILYSEQGKAGNAWMNANDYAVVSADYFRTTGITIVRGRDFEHGDARASAPVAIVDERAARRLWPDVPDAVGRMVKLGGLESPAPWIRVVGVAQAIDYLPRGDYDLPPDPVVYVVVPDDSTRGRELLVRSDGVNADRGRAELSLAVQRMVQAQLPTQGTVRVAPWLDMYETQRASIQFMASVFGAFAGFGLLLCAVGLYGVLAYGVSRRLRELAVRVALGARRRDVVRLVVHDAAVTALAGVGIGAFGALWFTRPIIDGLDTVSVSYAPVVALVASESVLLVVAFVAALGPVRRAAQADPLEIIRAS